MHIVIKDRNRMTPVFSFLFACLQKSCGAFTLKAVLLGCCIFLYGLQNVSASPKSGLYTPDIQMTTLKNGLTLMVVENRRAPVILQSITYKVGSMDEASDEHGIAHLLEHLMFRRLKYMTEDQITDMYNRFGQFYNATTYKDKTQYYQRFSSKHLEESIAFEAQRMQDLVLDPQEFLAERQVVMEERNQQVVSRPNRVAFEETLGMLVRNHSYRHPIIGYHDDIAKLTPEKVLSFYRRHYRPSNAMLSFVGDVSFEEALRLTEKYFGSIENPDGQTGVNQTTSFEPVQVSLMTQQVFSHRVSTSGVTLQWKAPGFANEVSKLAKEDFRQKILELYAEKTGSRQNISYRHTLALLIAVNILNFYGGDVIQELVERRKIASEFSASLGLWERGISFLTLSAQAAQPDTSSRELEDALLNVLDNYAQLFTAENVEKAKSALILDMTRALDSLPSLSHLMRNLFINGFVEEDGLDTLMAALQNTRPEDVIAAFSIYWDHSPYFVEIIHPETES